MQLEPQLRPQAYRRRRGGYLDLDKLWLLARFSTTVDDLRDHNLNLPSALCQLREPKGPQPAVPPTVGDRW
jgi:hypothetical protein